MKKYRVKVFTGKEADEWIFNASDFHTSERGYYWFKTEEGRQRYFPIALSTVEELE
jgi:hypothetical protein